MAPSPVKMAQDRPKTVPRRFQDGLEGYFFALENRVRFGIVLGLILAPFGLPKCLPLGTLFAPKTAPKNNKKIQCPKSRPKTTQFRPKTAQDRPKKLQEAPRGSQEAPKRLPRSSKSTLRGFKNTPKSLEECLRSPKGTASGLNKTKQHPDGN